MCGDSQQIECDVLTDSGQAVAERSGNSDTESRDGLYSNNLRAIQELALETSSQAGSGQTVCTAARLRTSVTKFEQEKQSAVGSKSVRKRIMTLRLMFYIMRVYF